MESSGYLRFSHIISEPNSSVVEAPVEGTNVLDGLQVVTVPICCKTAVTVCFSLHAKADKQVLL